ncbi:MAG: response regulator [Candidatus Cloacimonetes bacterium]|jgi:DNA-binding NtrC family response regulator|nr:response regulator [Candidatus Cloacimonadota bacterium]MDY0299592.1 response regulator [Candidatus Cloacimonadaceae bacterium]MCB5279170.1 response regulator [Candidatus Cloacimonadota bacterium]MCK9332116.1 response regulator [Candidatus Cloacimonadota bacterium]MDD2211048.1 response regulator [Candidatus Cloacimonadota bacterium]
MIKVICIVDDEEELVKNLKIEIQALRPEWEIHTFSDGLKALQMIMSGKVDLVLTDIAMPDMDGYELFWRVKDYNEKIPVIMMTGFGYDPNHVLVRAKVDGLKDVIFKPFDVEKLVTLIDRKISAK